MDLYLIIHEFAATMHSLLNKRTWIMFFELCLLNGLGGVVGRNSFAIPGNQQKSYGPGPARIKCKKSD